ncbi:hypothetical protein BW721_07190 [Jeotgalibaca sp. PTS2502]|uniref:BREX-1 system adenine-specific DNA-methyltransferase PglX n=1 Tax=Jeotgalibaca sp. PTS2502 TaxID=1903686 RepID=UPI0009735481|nr:BREX-1 system adenine-specific DNA-methyltransferase PglX [Jeotgalibaca sp. PTS2502]APZ49476.1 hypothetical protein BW721_07190 [Jeotgalibaca sp. PTS2502]
MDKTALKKFAAYAREKIRLGIEQKAFELGITAKGIQPLETLKDGLIVGERVLGEREARQYSHLKRRIEQEGYEAVIAEATYTWFNRMIALRFMEVNDYLPIKSHILSSVVPAKAEPDVLTNVTQYMDALDLDKAFVYRLREENRSEDLYHYILVQQCNKLGEIIPTVFETISDDMALLLPDGLLQDSSPIRDVVTMIAEEDWKNVEILGWLYQFYIADQKDTVFANLKKNKKIGKADIPAATQLFTPRWIVEYMVDNSLGRLWLEAYPDQDFEKSLTYYLEDAEQEPAVQAQLDALKQTNLDVESIRFLDPCCGSGHILVYAFEVFYKMYQARGYSKREIPALILEKNLFGLEIDRRAAQLATFAIIMKAREYDARLFSRTYKVNVHSIEESNELPKAHLDVFAQGDSDLMEEIELLVDVFYDAKIYGSIIQVPAIQIEAIQTKINYFQTESDLDIFTSEMIEYSLPLIQSLVNQYRLLAMTYEVVVTNPPYMGGRGMDDKLKKFLNNYYKDYSGDLFSAFIYRNLLFTEKNGYMGYMTPFVWMFIKSYEKLREYIITEKNIDSLVHLEYSAFEEATVPICTFVLRNTAIESKGIYIDLSSFRGGMRVQEKKYLEIKRDIEKSKRYEIEARKFDGIPGSPIAYWANNKIYSIFKNISVSKIIDTKSGIMTGDQKYIQFWYEPSLNNIKFNCESYIDMNKYTWFPINSGGGYRKFHGNDMYIVKLKNMGEEIRKNVTNFRLRDKEYYFKPGLTWGRITSSSISFREVKVGSLFGDAGPIAFIEDNNIKLYLLGLFNSKVTPYILSLINPTLNFQVRDIDTIPYVFQENYKVIDMVSSAIQHTRTDWDSFETSWDFKKHPFLNYPGERIADSFRQWESFADQQFRQLKANEEELNRIFIDIYGLQDELTPEVEDKDITVRRADYERDSRSFLSYLVGIIFGRYSLDKEGFAYAGGEWQPENYHTYQPDADNILPITEDGLFSDDLVKKVVELVTYIYGEETLEENLLFLAQALDKKVNERPEETIRRYFQKTFYKDHLKIYQKRPIYWLFSSGKRGAFKALIYMHRYDRDTVARIRTDYVLPLFMTLDNLITLEQQVVDSPDTSNQAKAAARKAIENYQKDKEELSVYSEVLDHIAKQRIELDLDDGVKVNYAKFQDITLISSQTTKKNKMHLLEKI